MALMTSPLRTILRSNGTPLLRALLLTHASHSHARQYTCRRQSEQLFGNRMSTMTTSTTKMMMATTTTPAKKTAPPSDDIKIVPAAAKDERGILDFLRVHYYREEPLTIGSEPKQQDPADEAFHMSHIQHGSCLMALQSRDDGCGGAAAAVVGALIAGPKEANEAELLAAEAKRLGPTKWGKALKLLECIERNANVFERYCVERVLHVHILAVDASVRGKALGARLMTEAMNYGRQQQFQLITADCSSVFSARLCERLGMECVNSLAYADYKDEQGEQVFKPPEPHVAVLTYAKRL